MSPLGPGQLGLFNLLKAYSLLDEEVAYCQGLSFIAGVLLLHVRCTLSLALPKAIFRSSSNRVFRPADERKRSLPNAPSSDVPKESAAAVPAGHGRTADPAVPADSTASGLSARTVRALREARNLAHTVRRSVDTDHIRVPISAGLRRTHIR